MDKTERALVYSVPVALLIVEGIASLAGLTPLPHQFLGTLRHVPFLTLAAIASAFLTVRRKEEVVCVLVVGSAIEAVRLLVLTALDTPLVYALSTTGAGYWYASLLLSMWQTARRNGAARLRAMDGAAIKFALPGSIPLILFALWQTYILHHTYDNYFYAFDGLLPIPVAEVAGRIFSAHPSLALPFLCAYGGVMLTACIFIALEAETRKQPSGALLSRWIVAGLFGCMLYFVMPGVGPHVAFDTVYPDKLPDPSTVPLSPFAFFAAAPRNAMPSLHTTWALLIAIAAWRMGSIGRMVALLNVAATIIATLGLREHYLIDLVVAVPFTLAVHGSVSLSSGSADRGSSVTAAVTGSILTGMWLLTIRYGTDALRGIPSIASLLVVGTLIVSAWLIIRMERRAASDAGDNPGSLPAIPKRYRLS